MVELWRKYFTLDKFAVRHEKPIIFILSQWQRNCNPSLWYLLVRWLIATTFLITWLLSFIGIRNGNNPPVFNAKWLIYLTNWGYTICTLQALISAIMITECIIKKSTTDLSYVAHKLYKTYWIIHTTATDIAFGITVLYWALIYDEKSMPLDAMNILMHGTNSILMILDLCIIAHPIKILHCYWPILFGIFYVIFSVIYFLAGGTDRNGVTYIYPILNWEKPGTTVLVCLGVMIFITVLHCLSYGLHRLKIWIHSRIVKSPKQDSSSEITETQTNDKGYFNEGLASDMV